MKKEQIKKIPVKSKSEFRRIKAQGGEPVLKKIGCPLCGDTENLQIQGRCVTCMSCGYSKCSI